jgi:hypothetical protein
VEGDVARLYGNELSTPIEKGAGKEFLISKLLSRQEHSRGLGRCLPYSRRSRLNNRLDKEAYDPKGAFGRFFFGFGAWTTR